MISVENLTKSFGPKLAVKGLTFSVEKGEVLGFLGPNGAGKSTTMRMVTGFIPPSAGSIKVGEFDMISQPIPAKRLIGYLPENAPLYPDMTVYGFLAFAAEIRGFSGEAKRQAVHKVVDMCFLESVLHQSIDTLSKGYRHRTCFAQSIIHDPPVLIMDEPTDGLDPNQKQEVRSLIRRMGEKKAIIFSTHILEEVEAACTRVIIIDRGQIVANGSPSELKRKSETAGTVLLRVAGVPVATVSQKLAEITEVRQTTLLKDDASRTTLRIYPRPHDGNANLARRVYETAMKEGWKVEELHTEEGRMEEVFRSITLPDTVKEVKA